MVSAPDYRDPDILWSGRRDSNPRPRAWKARALPTELLPLFPSIQISYWWRGKDSNLRSHKTADLQSAPFVHSGTSPSEGKNADQADGENRTRNHLITNQVLYR